MKTVRWCRLVALLLVITMVFSTVPILAESDAPVLSLNESQVMLAKGKTFQLKAVLSNAKANFSWKSDNEEIATVNARGSVSGKANGTASITCTVVLNDEISLTETCTVTVFTPVQSIKLPKDITVDVGKESEPLELTFTPNDASNKSVSWSTDNPEIATVDDQGKILGKKPGKCSVIVQSNETEAKSGKAKSAKCTVIVLQPVDDISVDVSSISVAKGSKEQINATVLPEDASNKKLSWKVQDSNIADVKNGQITGKNIGDTKVIVSVTNSDGSVVSKEINVHVFAPVLKVVIREKGKKIGVYPGETIDLHCDFEPKEAEYKDVEWSSDDSSVAGIIADSGKVTGKKPGQVKITVMSKEPGGKPKSDSFKLSVLTPVKSFEATCEKVIFTGKKAKITVKGITPANASNKKLKYSSSDSALARIDETGSIDARDTGLVTFTVSAADGQGAQKKVNVWILNKNNVFESKTSTNSLLQDYNKIMKQYNETTITSDEKEALDNSVAKVMSLVVLEYITSKLLKNRKLDENLSFSRTQPAYCFTDDNNMWCCFEDGDTNKYTIYASLNIGEKKYVARFSGYFSDENALKQFVMRRNGGSIKYTYSVSGETSWKAISDVLAVLNSRY